jgi:hypothetical protein
MSTNCGGSPGQLRDTIAKELPDAVVAELCKVADVKTFNMDGK